MLPPNPLTEFLEFLQINVQAYRDLGEGKLMVTCSKRPNDGRTPEYRLSLCGSRQTPCRVAPKDVQAYLLQSRSSSHSSTMSQPFVYLKTGLLEILQRTGYGEVTLEFAPTRQGNLVLSGQMMISDRFVISPR